jgi:hypothetical protein
VVVYTVYTVRYTVTRPNIAIILHKLYSKDFYAPRYVVLLPVVSCASIEAKSLVNPVIIIRFITVYAGKVKAASWGRGRNFKHA